ncbi:hypothetical protein GCM10009107_26920 [Ideonella azotifigens]|uniref:Uncharacterized protein n=1 Tax=Ideonella azotifigens TaxID=513160 RepID=A0ABN1K264_9BURK
MRWAGDCMAAGKGRAATAWPPIRAAAAARAKEVERETVISANSMHTVGNSYRVVARRVRLALPPGSGWRAVPAEHEREVNAAYRCVGIKATILKEILRIFFRLVAVCW